MHWLQGRYGNKMREVAFSLLSVLLALLSIPYFFLCTLFVFLFLLPTAPTPPVFLSKIYPSLTMDASQNFSKESHILSAPTVYHTWENCLLTSLLFPPFSLSLLLAQDRKLTTKCTNHCIGFFLTIQSMKWMNFAPPIAQKEEWTVSLPLVSPLLSLSLWA